MILGTIKVVGDVVHTHQASYYLKSVTNLVTPRPFLSAGAFAASAASSFFVAFQDILWPAEQLSLLVIAGLAVTAGFSIRRLEFVSRDLNSAQQTCIIYGTSAHVSQLRYEIVAAQQGHATGGSHGE